MKYLSTTYGHLKNYMGYSMEWWLEDNKNVRK